MSLTGALATLAKALTMMSMATALATLAMALAKTREKERDERKKKKEAKKNKERREIKREENIHAREALFFLRPATSIITGQTSYPLTLKIYKRPPCPPSSPRRPSPLTAPTIAANRAGHRL